MKGLTSKHMHTQLSHICAADNNLTAPALNV